MYSFIAEFLSTKYWERGFVSNVNTAQPAITLTIVGPEVPQSLNRNQAAATPALNKLALVPASSEQGRATDSSKVTDLADADFPSGAVRLSAVKAVGAFCLTIAATYALAPSLPLGCFLAGSALIYASRRQK